MDGDGTRQTNKLNQALLAQKIRWEGGLIGALSYGIHADDIEDPELARLWAELERLYNELEPLLEAVGDRLGSAA